MTRYSIAALLNDLIQTSHDGEKGFAWASREAGDPRLKAALVEGATRCRRGARELEVKVRELGIEPARGGSLAGVVYRGWLELKAAATGGDARAILAECERGEEFAKARYEIALDEDDLPADLRALLERQYRGVQRNHDWMRSLRNAQPH